jgi:hypothetical protein
MKTYIAEPLLNEAIEKLAFSEEFRLVAETHEFYTLADLLHYSMAELLSRPGFDYRIWNEYVAFMKRHRIGHYLN